jgi:Neuraminidase (sialidase)
MNNELSMFDSNNIDNLPMATKWAIQKQGAEKKKEVILSKLHEDGRVYLAHTALEHAGTLSALEQHLCQVTPHAEGRYRHIVDSYVMGASNRLARW